MGQWHIDNASALIVDGTRFTLQEVKYRIQAGDQLRTNTMWVKAGVQQGGGLAITKPLYLPDQGWAPYKPDGTSPWVQGMILKERTWTYYGEAGYSPGATQYQITTLSPYTPEEAAGWQVLEFENLTLYGYDPCPLYFDNRMAILGGGGLQIGGAVIFQFYGLAVR